MDDAGLARRLQAGDGTAWAEVYDRYADRLHDYCVSILRDPHEAEDALHDAFLAASERIGQLRDPERLRPWLYAVCRTTALGRARRRSRVVPSLEVGEMTAAPDAPDRVTQAELAALVWDAAEGLPPQDRAVLDLHLRHGLVGQDLAEALDVTPHHAAVRLSRVRELVERSLTVLLVARVGRRDCPDLDALLAGWDGQLDPRLRKRVARHIDDCEVCDEHRRTVVSPLALLATAPLVPAPTALRARVLADLDTTPRPPAGGLRRPAVVGIAVLVVAVVVALVAAITGGEDDERDALPIDATSTSASSATTTAPSISVAVVPGSTTPSSLAAPGAARLTLLTGDVHLFAVGTSFEIRLTNGGNTTLRWSATTDLAGVVLAPMAGETAPDGRSTIIGTVDRSGLPEGEFSGTVAVRGTDASTGATVGLAIVAVDGRVVRPPVITSATTDRTFLGVAGPAFCKVSAVHVVVADESSVLVRLSWRGGGAGLSSTTLVRDGDSWVGQLGPPSAAEPITWWIEAIDTYNGSVRSADQVLDVQAVC